VHEDEDERQSVLRQMLRSRRSLAAQTREMGVLVEASKAILLIGKEAVKKIL
jgi:hypothetical protein